MLNLYGVTDTGLSRNLQKPLPLKCLQLLLSDNNCAEASV